MFLVSGSGLDRDGAFGSWQDAQMPMEHEMRFVGYLCVRVCIGHHYFSMSMNYQVKGNVDFANFECRRSHCILTNDLTDRYLLSNI